MFHHKFFLSLLNKYLSSVKDLVIYFDDIMISADTKEERGRILDQVVQIARENNIKLIKIADNMPFDSFEFKQFSTDYKFKITTSSPYYPVVMG